MVANHLLQLLALTAMEAPVTFDADDVRDKKIEVLRSITPMTPEQVAERSVRIHYAAGESEGESVAGWREEPEVPAHSRTETFPALDLRIDNWRWAGSEGPTDADALLARNGHRWRAIADNVGACAR